MRSSITRARVARSAILTASLALVAACGAKTPGAVAEQPQESAAATAYRQNSLLVSDGTAQVTVDGTAVTFPTAVTDASWSPDGSRVAFVDGDGNISTAHPDGTGLVTLTKAAVGLRRSGPVWTSQGATISFTERTSAGASKVSTVFADGYGRLGTAWVAGLYDEPSAGDRSAVSASPVLTGPADVAYQQGAGADAEVWIIDTNQRDPQPSRLAAGSAPAVSPDGTKVAYVGRNGQVSVVAARDRAKPVQVTFGAAKPASLAWSADGRSVAYRTAAGVESVAADIGAGTTKNPATRLSDIAGVPGFLGGPTDRVVRIRGADAVGTAVAASQARWATQPKEFMPCECPQWAFGAVLVAADDPEAAVEAALRAGRQPLLFTGGATLDKRTEAELARLFGKVRGSYGPTIQLVGVVPAAVEKRLKELRYEVERVTGDRYELAAKSAGSYAERVVLVSTADTATLAAATSTQKSFGVLLTDGAELPAATAAYLRRLRPETEVFTLGADAGKALADWSDRPASLKATAVAGADDTATALLTVQLLSLRVQGLVVVDRTAAQDVLAAATLANGDRPLLLVEPSGELRADVRDWIDRSTAGLADVWIVDTAGSVSGPTAQGLGDAISGPLGFTTVENWKISA